MAGAHGICRPSAGGIHDDRDCDRAVAHRTVPPPRASFRRHGGNGSELGWFRSVGADAQTDPAGPSPGRCRRMAVAFSGKLHLARWPWACDAELERLRPRPWRAHASIATAILVRARRDVERLSKRRESSNGSSNDFLKVPNSVALQRLSAEQRRQCGAEHLVIRVHRVVRRTMPATTCLIALVRNPSPPRADSPRSA